MNLDLKTKASRQQMAILAALILLGGYTYWSGRSEDTGPVPMPAPKPVTKIERPNPSAAGASGPARASRQQEQNRVFKPSMKFKDRPDPTKIDPSLRLDLLAHVREVSPVRAGRNIFEFGSAPAVPIPTVKVKVRKGTQVASTVMIQPPVAQQPSGPPPPPPPPPIPLKFFGFVASDRNTIRRGFFAEGEDIFVASEGELIHKRYRVVRINLSSVVMEDTETKSQQTLPLEEQTV